MTKCYIKSYIKDICARGRVAWEANATLNTRINVHPDTLAKGRMTYRVETMGAIQGGGFGTTNERRGCTLSQAVALFAKWEEVGAI